MKEATARKTAYSLAAILFLVTAIDGAGADTTNSTMAEVQGAEPPAASFTIEDVLSVASVSAGELSADGRWLIFSTRTLRDRLGTDNHRYGDPTYVSPGVAEVRIVDTNTGEARPLFAAKKQVRGLKFSPDAARLAFMEFDGDWWRAKVWARASGEVRDIVLPAGMELADNTVFYWLPDGSGLFLALRPREWRTQTHERFLELTQGPVVVLSSEDDFLAWEELRRRSLNRSLYLFDLDAGTQREVLEDSPIRSYEVAEDGSFLTYLRDITGETDYERIFGSESSVEYLPLGPGESYTILDSDKGVRLRWSGDHHAYAYTKEGKIFFATVDSEPREIEVMLPEEAGEGEEEPPADTDDEPADEEEEEDRFSIVRLSHTGDAMILSNKQGLWMLDTATDEARLILEIDREDDDAPRYSVTAWTRDGERVLFSYASRTQWERGFVRYEVGSGEMVDLVKDGSLYSGVRLSDDGGTLVLSISQANRPSDLYVTDLDFTAPRRLTDANPGIHDRALSDPELISYLDVDGEELEGVLYTPVGYQPGTPVPTIFHIYETFFDPRFSSTTNLLLANGYAVVQPSVNLEIGYPGEAWVKGVTAAANKLIEMGVADPERLGVYGTSYGGYATNLLITQTQRFKAAVNISGKVNMVSFYTDSPRLGIRNVHAPENSQDRIGNTLWEQPHKYISHSAVMYADRITTPLLLLTGEQDHNVPARQAMEMYYAMRRLGKRVEWVNYTHGGHGMPRATEEEVVDYHHRLLDWFDTYLKADEDEEAGEKKK